MKKNILLLLVAGAAIFTSAQVTELKTDKDKLSYGIGLHIAQNFKQQNLSEDIDATALKQGLSDELTDQKINKEKFSYGMGVNIAQSFKQQEITGDIDVNILSQAITAVLKDEQPIVPQDSLINFINQYFKNKQEEKQKNFETERKAEGEKNKAEGEKFLAANKKKKGVTTTASGLQYEVIKKSKSTEKPTVDDIVTVTYKGTLLNGTEFDSTDKNNNGKPLEFGLNQMIKGWQEGIPLMTKGSTYRFYLPSNLAYGESGAGREIGPNAVLIFDVTLQDFKPETQP
ncbi:MAG: FKBP-type peptidyl-prolyl cis-trans isomerase [Flavobacteriaceae bacterium]|jgi:FKBP-type peptidyl-prolyl cis-trans isomerase FklB|nr:FKBP-type peptidyl-prolyl cis-trans isomerase [Flavobacteriaceae bacterium]